MILDNPSWNWDAYSAQHAPTPKDTPTMTTAPLEPVVRKAHPAVRLLVLLALVVASWAVLIGIGVAVAHAEPIAHPCAVNAVLLDSTHVQLADKGTACIAPQVTVQAWLAPSADGRPLAAQQLAATAYDGILPLGKTITVQLVGWDLDSDCYRQVDAAYGHARADLTTPYGPDLIAAWHAGTHSCLWSPPPSSSPPAPSSTPPAPSATPSATTPPPAPSSTPPPSTTAPAPTSPAVTPTPTGCAPECSPPATPTPTHKPRKVPHIHKPTPTPTPTRTTVPPAPSASGCIASGCHTPTPAPSSPAVLPYTGTNMPTGPIVAIASAGILFGVGCLALSAYLRRRPQ